MNVILDTHVLVWWEGDQAKISPRASRLIEDPSNRILVSDVSFWEMVIKAQAGKPMIRGSVRAMVDRQVANGLTHLPISIEHVLGVESLPMIHKDPFDRLLIAQAIVESAVLVSADQVLAHYPVPVLW